MAVDTRAKRLSMLNMGTGDLLPDPNTSGVDQSERQTFLDSYSGILWTAVGPVIDNAKFSLLSYQQPFNSPIPAPVGGALTQGDNQHLMWQYAGIDWAAVVAGRIMSSLAGSGGLAHRGGVAGPGGGLAGS